MDNNVLQENLMRFSQYYQIMCLWMNTVVENKTTIDKYLFDKGYRQVSVYGMNGIGECLTATLKKSQLVNLKCCIDRNAENCFDDEICIVNLDNIPDGLDVIIVALTDRYEEIKQSLNRITDSTIISFEEILYSIQKEEENNYG